MVRHWGVIFLIALGFLILAVCVREQPETVPVESLAPMGIAGLLS
jgi:hypothetical protein